MGEVYYLNRNWRFNDCFEGSFLIEPMSTGKPVEIPHIFHETSYNYINKDKLRTKCVYQRCFIAREEWRGKRIFLTFEGVAYKASVYINGVNQVINQSISIPFEADIGSKVNFGEENLITVIVDSGPNLNQPPFYEDAPVDIPVFGGIYRDVYLTVKEQISMEDVYYLPGTALPIDTLGMNRQKLSNYKLPGNIKSIIKLSEAAVRMAGEHRLSVRQILNEKEISFQPIDESGVTETTTGPVHIWDLDSPTCYRLQTDLLLDDMVIDTDVSMIGFRTTVFNQRGFYLNGRKIKIRGVIRYQSYPYMGYAAPESLQRLDARILKEELHVNAVRCCGEFPSQYFLDECNKRGILVFPEVPGYRDVGDEEFREIHLKNVEQMIIRGRNHPCIFLWGTRINGSASMDFDNEAVKIAHSLDPTRATGGERLDTNMPLAEDVYCYRDLSYSGKAAPLRSKEEVTSDMSRPYLVCGYMGESYSVRPGDSPKRKLGQIARIAGVLDAQAFHEDTCGSFAGSMCDYPTMAEFAAEDGIAYHGILDMFRNKKPAACVFSSQNNSSKELFVYPSISGDRERWEGTGDIFILTNMDSVKTYRDNQFICEYQREDSPFGNMRHPPIIMNDFVGEAFAGRSGKTDHIRRLKKLINQMAAGGLSSFLVPGQMLDFILSKIVYRTDRRELISLYEKYVSRSHEYRFEGIKNGKVEAVSILKPCTKRFIKADISSMNLIEKYCYDVIQIRITVVNESGEVLSDFAEPIIVNTMGPVSLIGPGIISLRGGMAGTYIRSTGKEGEARITISCGDLPDTVFTVNVLKAPQSDI